MSILIDADMLVEARKETRGDINEVMSVIAALQLIYLAHLQKTDSIKNYNATHATMMMKLMKIGREITGSDRDNILDDAGYSKMYATLKGWD